MGKIGGEIVQMLTTMFFSSSSLFFLTEISQNITKQLISSQWEGIFVFINVLITVGFVERCFFLFFFDVSLKPPWGNIFKVSTQRNFHKEGFNSQVILIKPETWIVRAFFPLNSVHGPKKSKLAQFLGRKWYNWYQFFFNASSPTDLYLTWHPLNLCCCSIDYIFSAY